MPSKIVKNANLCKQLNVFGCGLAIVQHADRANRNLALLDKQTGEVRLIRSGTKAGVDRDHSGTGKHRDAVVGTKDRKIRWHQGCNTNKVVEIDHTLRLEAVVLGGIRDLLARNPRVAI